MTGSANQAQIKNALKTKMLSLEEAELAAARAHYDSFLKEAALDSREVHDKDDLVASRENADLAAAFDHPVHAHQGKIEAISNMDFSPTDTVRLGAVVVFGGRRFVAAVSTSRFECDGEEYMGISPQSPIFQAINGLQAGDSFTLNGRDLKLDLVM